MYAKWGPVNSGFVLTTELARFRSRIRGPDCREPMEHDRTVHGIEP